MFLPSHRCVVTFVQTDRKTNRQRKDFNKGGAHIYLFLLTHFHGSCMLARLSPTYFTVGACSCVRVEEEKWKFRRESGGGGVEK